MAASAGAPEPYEPAQLARRRTRLALATLLVLLLALLGVALYAATRLYTTSEDRYVKEALPLRGDSRDLLLQMVNEETAVRGYLITTDPQTLQPSVQAHAAVVSDLAGLQRLMRRRPEIAPEVAAARRSIAALGAYFRSQIALVRRGPTGQLRAQARLLDGKTLFDSFRRSAGQLVARADTIVSQAERDERRTFWEMVAVVLSAGGAAIVIALGLLFVLPERMRALYQQELDARRVAERGARAASSLAHVTDAVILVDPTGILRYWNGAAARNFGVTDPDALDRPIAAVLPEIDAIDASLARGDARAVVPIARGGFEHWFTLAENRFADGRVLVLRDVTAEQQLERTRSEFLATASHELRTPLAAVYGAVRTLRRGDRRVAPELEEQLLRIIDHEAQRLALIVDQILVSAQLDRRGLYLHREHVDLRELAESARASALLAAGPRHAIELDAPASVEVEADPSRLRQVLVNLLDNALKYSPDGGHVELRVCEHDGRGRVEVADRGIGIAQESVPRIFEKFFRADPDMHTGVGGSGLGLYISRELVEQMGGTIAVDSQPGRGSTFVVELPLRE